MDQCIDSGYVSSVGNFVTEFENRMAARTGSKYATAVVNGTSALHLSLVLADVSGDDEVISQPLTFIATINAITYTGAKPVFIDVDKDTLGLSPEKLEHFLSENTEIKNDKCINKKTKKTISACIPVHIFGHPARIDWIADICRKYKIKLIEDAAESAGSKYKGKQTGSFGLIGVQSFNGNKIITTGGGGMLLTDDKYLAEKAKYLSTQARIPHKWEFSHDVTGYNYRMPNINAALGCAQLENLDYFVENKRKLAGTYREFFNSLNIPFVTEPENSFSNYWLNTILFKNRVERDSFLEFSNNNQVMTRPAWNLAHTLKMFKDCQSGNLDNAIWLEDKLVNIPSSVIIP